MVVAVLVMFAGCYEPPYAGPLWGDPCLTDKGQNVVSGCTHQIDGTGDPGWHSGSELGMCAPPSADTLAATPERLRSSGYTGSCRPFCDLGDDGSWSCPMGGVPTIETHSLRSGLEFCYCADPDVDDVSLAAH